MYFFVILLIFGALGYMELSKIKAQLRQQQKQIDALCEVTGNKSVSINYISEELKCSLSELKAQGKDVEAIRKLRKATEIDLLEVKEYVNRL